MASNIYGELFEQLPIPERLEPDNIVKMLDEHMLAQGKRSAIAVSESSAPVKKTATSAKRGRSATYRAIMSVAACALLVLGLMRYNANDSVINTEDPVPGSYASDYDDIHKTFQKFYVDDSNKTTLDTAIAEIEHSYNEADSSIENDVVEKNPTVTTSSDDKVSQENTPVIPDDEPSDIPADDHEEIIDEPSHIILPDVSEYSNDLGIIADSQKLFVRDGNAIRIFTASPALDAYAYIVPECAENETKTMVGFTVVGDRLAVVYSVETLEVIEETQVDDNDDTQPESDSVLDNIITGTFADEVETKGILKYSAEVVVYHLADDGAYIAYTQSQGGKYVDSVAGEGSVYVVTDYCDYRLAPLVGVDDLDSYVPTYTVNGEKRHLPASDILIPSKITTTDYTVISGINLAASSLETSIQALLGYEGRIKVTDSAVYVFGYETESATGTGVEIFSLSDGTVSNKGYSVIDGLALSGDGITVIGDSLIVVSISDSETGYYTTLKVYNDDFEILSKVEFPALLTNVAKDGSTLYLNNAERAYAVDLSNPLRPKLSDVDDERNICDYLVTFEDGYAALIDDDGKLVLTKIIEDVNGELRVCAQVTVCDTAYTSKALVNNALMYVGGNLIGVPYGYFDGLDYCYTYALYKSGVNGFELVGTFETHETDSSFEFGGAKEYNGRLYVFSDGRVYELSADENALAFVSKSDIIYSTYSGHNNW